MGLLFWVLIQCHVVFGMISSGSSTFPRESKRETPHIMKNLQDSLPPPPAKKNRLQWQLLLTILTTLSILYSLHELVLPPREHHSLQLSSISGFFIQDQLNSDPSQFHIYHPNSSFGLINNHSPDRWQTFKQQINHLIKNSPSDIRYKVFFIARHGQGFHNIAESKYGTTLWDCYWSEKNTDGELIWGPDARLTEQGKREARLASKAWKLQLDNDIPFPQLFILSPLSRAIETMRITGVWNHVSNNRTYHPRKTVQIPKIIVTENWRENIGLHTCDKRRSKSDIRVDYPFVEFEDRFTENDILWTKDLQETDKQLDVRIKGALSRVFEDPTSSNLTYVSITAHSGVISSVLRVIGHRPWPTETGGMIPLVIRAKLTRTPTHPPNPSPSATKPICPSSSYSPL
ncbi:hypothetical protein MJO28_013660 [Puccinia striiformis f. sp. tritici]|uniref:Uncharacterized protein n=1 Tax=Puccinia striiformis f. sp. tritici TaxID=168172 RepID=A0ACC0DV13_9BASI|nr:hypothetical protein MJO28_013660 [Puccinia striiformis f. sp. tritici]